MGLFKLVTIGFAGSLIIGVLVPISVQAAVINPRQMRLCQTKQDADQLANNITGRSFVVSPKVVNNWRSNGLQVPQATTAQSVVVTASSLVRVNGYTATTVVSNIDVTLPLLNGGDSGDYINTAVAAVRVQGYTLTGCFNAPSREDPFRIQNQFDFELKNVKIRQRTPESGSGILKF